MLPTVPRRGLGYGRAGGGTGGGLRRCRVRRTEGEVGVASVEECEAAFGQLADRLAGADPATRKKAAFDRTLTCTLRDLSVTFGARLHDGQLLDIHRVDDPKAQVRMTMTSDVLLALVAGELGMASAWASGRIKIEASVLDLLRLRSVF